MRNYHATPFAIVMMICATFLAVSCSKQSSPPATPQAIVAPVVLKQLPPHTPTVTIYNGLISADMGPITSALTKQGDNVRVLWHDEQEADGVCPEYIAGHSMGGNAAIRQANKCQAMGHPPKAIVVIDAGRAPLTYQIPANAKYLCASFYNSAHPIGGQEIFPDSPDIKLGSCHNTLVPGYTHIYMPSAPGIIRGALKVIPPATK